MPFKIYCLDLSGPRLLPHAVPLRRWWNADICVEARPPQAEYPEEHFCHGALQEHGQESHHRGPQHCPGHTAPEQHHVRHSNWDQCRTGPGNVLNTPSQTVFNLGLVHIFRFLIELS